MVDDKLRQVAPDVAGIRLDHTTRYGIVDANGRAVVDIGCGVGYGAQILREAGAVRVLGIDSSRAAVEYARAHYSAGAVTFEQADVDGCPERWLYTEVAVCFELLEHLAQPARLLRRIDAETLYASVPNEDAFPWTPELLEHRRHYTAEQFDALLRSTGWEPVEWWGQADHEAAPVPGREGRTLVVRCVRTRPLARYIPRLGYPPATVCLTALGPSKMDLIEWMVQHDYTPQWNELWTLNTGVRLFPSASLAFVMDDLGEYSDRHPAYAKALREFRGEIISQCTTAPPIEIDFAEYPLAEVLDFWKLNADRWLHTISIGYILAYAGFIGVKRLLLCGVDCSWPNNPDLREAGQAQVAYWIGRLSGVGCEVSINGSSTLNGTRERDAYGFRKFYGYLRQPLY